MMPRFDFIEPSGQNKNVSFVCLWHEWRMLKTLAQANNVTIGQYVRAICIDAIAEENALVQCIRTEGRTEQGKAGEASGRPAP